MLSKLAFQKILFFLAFICRFHLTSSYLSTFPSFVTQHKTLSYNEKLKTFRLNAKTISKKKKKSGKSSSKTSGGFGAPTTTSAKKKSGTPKTSKQDDFVTFPPLDANVKETLIPSTPEASSVAGELSNEIYARLGEIYGFPDFNYLDVEESLDPEPEPVDNLSFEDLISNDSKSSPDSSSSSSSSSSSLLGKPSLSSDLSDLIASATGDTTSEPTSSTTSDSTTLNNLPISKLPAFEKFRVLHVDPLVLCIDDFFTESECDALIAHSDPTSSKNKMNNPTNIHMAPMMSRSKTVGKDAMSQAQRTSTTWFHHFQGKEIAPLMAKSCRLLGLDSIERWEEPQTVRYRGTEKFTWHLDALSPSEDLMKAGGQRTATLLVYLNSLDESSEEESGDGESPGGNTMFRDLGANGEFLKVPPKKGSALLFFPAAGGIPNTPFDIRTLHCGEAVAASSPNDKWIAQLWLRQKDGYKPTAPPGNTHASAEEDVSEYCLHFGN